MCSERQAEANRLNAQKSTGPKTPEGKAKVAQNAVTHGLTAQRPVLSTENPEEYSRFQEDLTRELAPEGVFESILAGRVVNQSWRLKRAQNYETLVLDNLIKNMLSAEANLPDGKQGLVRSDDRQVVPVPLSSSAGGNTLAFVLEYDFMKEHLLEKIQRYEGRIERSFFRALKELRKVQSLRLQQNSNADGKQGLVRSDDRQVVPVPAFRDNAQNKANSVGADPCVCPNEQNKPKFDARQLSNLPEMNTLAPDILKGLMKGSPGLPKMFAKAM